MKQKLYVDFAGGRFDCWFYSEGLKFWGPFGLNKIRAFAAEQKLDTVYTQEAKLFLRKR